MRKINENFSVGTKQEIKKYLITPYKKVVLGNRTLYEPASEPVSKNYHEYKDLIPLKDILALYDFDWARAEMWDIPTTEENHKLFYSTGDKERSTLSDSQKKLNNFLINDSNIIKFYTLANSEQLVVELNGVDTEFAQLNKRYRDASSTSTDGSNRYRKKIQPWTFFDNTMKDQRILDLVDEYVKEFKKHGSKSQKSKELKSLIDEYINDLSGTAQDTNADDARKILKDIYSIVDSGDRNKESMLNNLIMELRGEISQIGTGFDTRNTRPSTYNANDVHRKDSTLKNGSKLDGTGDYGVLGTESPWSLFGMCIGGGSVAYAHIDNRSSSKNIKDIRNDDYDAATKLTSIDVSDIDEGQAMQQIKAELEEINPQKWKVFDKESEKDAIAKDIYLILTSDDTDIKKYTIITDVLNNKGLVRDSGNESIDKIKHAVIELSKLGDKINNGVFLNNQGEVVDGDSHDSTHAKDYYKHTKTYGGNNGKYNTSEYLDRTIELVNSARDIFYRNGVEKFFPDKLNVSDEEIRNAFLNIISKGNKITRASSVGDIYRNLDSTDSGEPITDNEYSKDFKIENSVNELLGFIQKIAEQMNFRDKILIFVKYITNISKRQSYGESFRKRFGISLFEDVPGLDKGPLEYNDRGERLGVSRLANLHALKKLRNKEIENSKIDIKGFMNAISSINKKIKDIENSPDTQDLFDSNPEYKKWFEDAKNFVPDAKEKIKELQLGDAVIKDETQKVYAGAQPRKTIDTLVDSAVSVLFAEDSSTSKRFNNILSSLSYTYISLFEIEQLQSKVNQATRLLDKAKSKLDEINFGDADVDSDIKNVEKAIELVYAIAELHTSAEEELTTIFMGQVEHDGGAFDQFGGKTSLPSKPDKTSSYYHFPNQELTVKGAVIPDTDSRIKLLSDQIARYCDITLEQITEAYKELYTLVGSDDFIHNKRAISVLGKSVKGKQREKSRYYSNDPKEPGLPQWYKNHSYDRHVITQSSNNSKGIGPKLYDAKNIIESSKSLIDANKKRQSKILDALNTLKELMDDKLESIKLDCSTVIQELNKQGLNIKNNKENVEEFLNTLTTNVITPDGINREQLLSALNDFFKDAEYEDENAASRWFRRPVYNLSGGSVISNSQNINDSANKLARQLGEITNALNNAQNSTSDGGETVMVTGDAVKGLLS